MVHLTVTISLSGGRGLLWLRHEPLQSLAFRFGTNSFLLRHQLYYLVSQVPLFGLSKLLSSLWVSRTGSASDWCALQEALYKCIDTIQYNTIIFCMHEVLVRLPWFSARIRCDLTFNRTYLRCS